MAKKTIESVFKTDKRIKLGVWGLGRGRSFYESCKLLNMDVVAGCDYNPDMRENFLTANPGAFVTDKAEEFLARDFDAVILATFCPAHADDAIACLKAGKHVMSEVTSFHTMAEGVRLVEAVEQSGLVYNLAENYPFSALNMWLKRRWDEGVFGNLMYAEFEYVHELVALSYTYIDGKPVQPGNQVHNWRSWLNIHYYNTHSLGPIMYITGLRPIRVVALPSQKVNLPGYPFAGGTGTIAPSLINMSNGSVIRNLMGGTTNDTHNARLWGTRGAAQLTPHGGAELRLGGRGGSPALQITPHWEDFGKLAAAAGHGGGDFWTTYFFARQILFGEPAPFDIYTGADCTAAGILAYRSTQENGKAYDIPNFRNKAERETYRNDHFAQPRYDVKTGLFGKHSSDPLTLTFSKTMLDLINHTMIYQAFQDWNRVRDDLTDPAKLLSLIDAARATLPALQDSRRAARALAERFPGTDAARVLNDFLGMIDRAVDRTDHAKYLQSQQRQSLKLARRSLVALAKAGFPDAIARLHIQPRESWKVSPLLPKNDTLAKAPCVRLARKLAWQKGNVQSYDFPDGAQGWKVVVHDIFEQADGLAYIGNRFNVTQDGKWEILLGYDGGVKLFVDGKAVFSEPRRQNPITPDRSKIMVNLAKGIHEIMIALDTNHGLGWGVILRFRPSAEIVAKLRG